MEDETNEFIEDQESTSVDTVANAIDTYSEQTINKIQLGLNQIDEVKTLGLTNDNLKKVFAGVGILSTLMFAKRNKVALLALAGGAYVYKKNKSEIDTLVAENIPSSIDLAS